MKFKISKFYIGIYIFGIISVSGVAFYSLHRILTKSCTILEYLPDIVSVIICAIGFFSFIYSTLFDFQFGTCHIDEDGITLHIGFKKHHHRWEEFTDCDIVGVSVDSVGGKNVANAYWVYFATNPLTYKEKVNFLRKTRRDLKRIAFFQYNAKILDSVLPFIPEQFRGKLKEKGDMIQNNLNIIEKVYNK